MPVAEGALEGFVEQTRYRDGVVRISGWSARRSLGAAKEVVVFADGRFLIASRPSAPRGDVATTQGTPSLLSGFNIVTSLGRAPEEGDLRVFGIAGGKASELPQLDP